MTIKLVLVSCIAILFCAVSIYPQTASNMTAAPEVKIPGTQMLKVHSSIVGRDYILDVNLPRDYDDTTKTFPVVYVLDGQWDFPLVASIYGQQYYDGFVPGLIVVGVTWGGENPNYDSLRAFDFSPTSVNQPDRYGNAPKFLKFIKDELIPFIQSKYRVDKNDRTLMGSSMGGLFTIYTLLNQTSIFNKYVCTSPVVTWDHDLLFKMEKKYAENNSKLPVKLYMAVGGYENIKPLEKFAEQIKEGKFEGLKFRSKVIEGMGHSGGKSEGFSRGIQFVFERPPVKVDQSVLEKYAGDYQAAPDLKIKIAVENNLLVANLPDGMKVVFHASSDKDFYAIGFYAVVHFKTDNKGGVTGFELEQYAGKNFIKKIND